MRKSRPVNRALRAGAGDATQMARSQSLDTGSDKKVLSIIDVFQPGFSLNKTAPQPSGSVAQTVSKWNLVSKRESESSAQARDRMKQGITKRSNSMSRLPQKQSQGAPQQSDSAGVSPRAHLPSINDIQSALKTLRRNTSTSSVKSTDSQQDTAQQQWQRITEGTAPMSQVQAAAEVFGDTRDEFHRSKDVFKRLDSQKNTKIPVPDKQLALTKLQVSASR